MLVGGKWTRRTLYRAIFHSRFDYIGRIDACNERIGNDTTLKTKYPSGEYTYYNAYRKNR